MFGSCSKSISNVFVLHPTNKENNQFQQKNFFLNYKNVHVWYMAPWSSWFIFAVNTLQESVTSTDSWQNVLSKAKSAQYHISGLCLTNWEHLLGEPVSTETILLHSGRSYWLSVTRTWSKICCRALKMLPLDHPTETNLLHSDGCCWYTRPTRSKICCTAPVKYVTQLAFNSLAGKEGNWRKGR